MFDPSHPRAGLELVDPLAATDGGARSIVAILNLGFNGIITNEIFHALISSFAPCLPPPSALSLMNINTTFEVTHGGIRLICRALRYSGSQNELIKMIERSAAGYLLGRSWSPENSNVSFLIRLKDEAHISPNALCYRDGNLEFYLPSHPCCQSCDTDRAKKEP